MSLSHETNLPLAYRSKKVSEAVVGGRGLIYGRVHAAGAIFIYKRYMFQASDGNRDLIMEILGVLRGTQLSWNAIFGGVTTISEEVKEALLLREIQKGLSLFGP